MSSRGDNSPCEHPRCRTYTTSEFCERHRDYTPDFAAPEPDLGGGIGVPRPFGGARPDVPLTGDSPSPDPTPVLACLDCETAWVEHGEEWAHCPRCGAELTELEAGDD